jgi:hypothetical protein
MIALNPSWSERYLEGSPEKEAELLRVFVQQIGDVQQRNRRSDGDPVHRAFHAKLLAGIAGARFVVSDDVRPELRTALFTPGAGHPALVRFSNASGIVRSDADKDLRGIAIRVDLGQGAIQDLLLTNAPASHARDARQFMVAAVAMAGGRRLAALPQLMWRLGFREALRMILALQREASRPVSSVATEAFYSRAPFAVGPYAVKFRLQPTAPEGETSATPSGTDSLRDEMIERLKGGDVRFELQVLHYVDERVTPIEDGTVEWTDRDARPETVAELLIPRQDLTEGEGPKGERMVDALEFNPWNTTEGIRPIGGLNRARKPVYEASARLRASR